MTVGVVLAGGLARRMGGGDKGLRLVGGRSVLSRVIERLGPQVSAVAINANGDGGRLAEFGLAIVPDDVPGRPGPLAGVLAGMEWAAGLGEAWVVSVPWDCPFIPVDLVGRLVAGLGDREMACAGSRSDEAGGRVHPVVGLWPVSMRGRLRGALEGGLRKVGAFTEGAAVVEWGVEGVDPFFNVNTPEELAEAEVIAGQIGGGRV